MIKRILFGLLLIPIFGFVSFYFWASSATLSRNQYDKIETLDAQLASIDNIDTLKALTYNIGYLSGMTNNEAVISTSDFYDRNLNRAVAIVNQYNPDILGLQEIDFGAQRSYAINQANELGSRGDFFNAYNSINWDKRYVPFPYGLPKYNFGKMLSGQSILAKSTLLPLGRETLPKPINAPFYYNAFYLDRLIQIADWVVGNDTIKVMNLHLEAFDKETRLLHGEKVRELYEAYYQDGPLLILGDFNSQLPQLSQDAMSIILDAPEIASAVDWQLYQTDSTSYYTYSSVDPVYMIDYILFNSNFIERIDAGVLREAGDISDHLPLYFEFVLK